MGKKEEILPVWFKADILIYSSGSQNGGGVPSPVGA